MHPTLQNALLNSTLRVVSGVANTTQNLLTNVIKKQNGTDKGGTDYGDKGHPFLSQKRRFMLMVSLVAVSSTSVFSFLLGSFCFNLVSEG